MFYLHSLFFIFTISTSFCMFDDSEKWAVEFNGDSESAKSFAEEMGLKLEERLYPWNVYIFSSVVSKNASNDGSGIIRSYYTRKNVLDALENESKESGSFPTSPVQTEDSKAKVYRSLRKTPNKLMNKYDVKWIEKQEPMDISPRGLYDLQIHDPKFPMQWHLNGKNKYGLDVIPVWSAGYFGRNVNVTVADSCVEYGHPDLKQNFIDKLDDTLNMVSCYHGTAVAGIISAVKNEYCGVGVAYKSRFFAVTILGYGNYVSDYLISKKILWNLEHTDIYSNSWGPKYHKSKFVGPGPLFSQAIDLCIKNGRNGKGSIYIWAVGDMRGFGGYCSYDGFVSNRKVICVGASGYDGVVTKYSEGCPSVLVVAPSATLIRGHDSPIRTTGIGGKCTNNFGGTSAACPMVSGVVALMLEANPNLNWLEVQDILVQTARKVNVTGYKWRINGAGLKHNEYFGFGIVNAIGAVHKAIWYAAVGGPPEEFKLSRVLINKFKVFHAATIPFVFTKSFKVHHAEIHTIYVKNDSIRCKMVLTSAYGTKSLLQRHDRRRVGRLVWTHTVKSIWGEDSRGKWTIRIISDIPTEIKYMSVSLYGLRSKDVVSDEATGFIY